MAQPNTLPLQEQVLAAEVGYYQQCATLHPTPGDEEMRTRGKENKTCWLRYILSRE